MRAGPLEFQPDIRLVTRSRLARAVANRLLKPRLGVTGYVLHTTGRGVLTRAKRWNVDPFEAAIRIYSTLMDDSGHFVIGQGVCQVAQVVPLSLAARHVGIRGTGAAIPVYSRYDWWRQRWPEFTHPYELKAIWGDVSGSSAPSANSWTVGIEIVPPEDLGAPLSEHCWASLASLLEALGRLHRVQRTRTTIVTHSDAAPQARTTREGHPYDPPISQWTWDEYAYRAAVPMEDIS